MFDLPIVTRCALLECRRLQAEPLLGDGTVRRLRKQRRPCRLSSDAPPTADPQSRSHRRVAPSIPINPALPARSEERRVWDKGVSTSVSLGSRHLNKKKKKIRDITQT